MNWWAMKQEHTILVINPGSTSTKLAVFEGDQPRCMETIPHHSDQLKCFPRTWDQFSYRLELCKRWANDHVEACSAVVAIGGLFRPIEGGTYRINEQMMNDARANLQGEHASNLGCALAYELGNQYGCPSFVGDPVSVDEFEPLARYSGHPLVSRRSLSHALSIHAAARRAADDLGLPLRELSFVIGHLGGGISIAPVRSGRIIDANDAASDGPFSPERTGGLPLQPVVSLCFSGEYTEHDVRSMIMGKGGLAAYLGTNSMPEVEERIRNGDRAAREVYDAMAYQIAKEIGAMATVLQGTVNAIILTGGLARSSMLTASIEDRVRFLAPVMVYPDNDEMQALAYRALSVLHGEELPKEY
jgi:butyrate kinase